MNNNRFEIVVYTKDIDIRDAMLDKLEEYPANINKHNDAYIIAYNDAVRSLRTASSENEIAIAISFAKKVFQRFW